MRKDGAASVRVRIFGADYLLRGAASPDYTKRLAACVDRTMREVSSQASLVSTTRIAVLAALRLADELHRGKRGKAGSAADDRRLMQLVRKVDGLVKMHNE